jgi:hypothetical protein
MIKKFHHQLTIAFIAILLVGVSYESLRGGINKVRIYEVIMLGYLVYALIKAIIDFIKSKNQLSETEQ